MPRRALSVDGGLTTLWDGTNPAGLANVSEVADVLGIGGPAYATVREFCSSCRQFLRNSHFFRKLRARGIFSPKVDYTSIVTRNDELVFPYTSGIARRPATAATSCCRSTARSTRPSTLGDG